MPSTTSTLRFFCVALYRAMAKGRHFMFRTAASFVRVLGGISAQPLLTREQMIQTETAHGGIIVVGSHTDLTNKQLEKLHEIQGIKFIEVNAELVTETDAFEKEIERCLSAESEAIENGVTVCIYTTRRLITAGTRDKEDDLRLAVRISDALQSLVGNLDVVPEFVIAKGGITSSDVATKALSIEQARVLGQICPGIPVWQAGDSSKFPKVPYIVFPGNVGTDETLKQAVYILLG